ncbi:MAG TPA: cellulose-binding protein [Ktedonobacteraceae bacterium]|nr:cellulose-binding protein [Ktedonobacteraceae bacterium]
MTSRYTLLHKNWSRRMVALILALGAILAGTIATSSSAAAYSPRQAQNVAAAQATINAGSSLGAIPGTAFGINTAAWDSHLLDASVPGMLRQDGVKVMRYPGGSTSDYYHWQSNTTETCSICGTVNANDTFDAFMGVVQATGAQAIITVNYGSGTPQEAAGWVQYANKGGPGYNGPIPTYPGGSSTGHNYGIKYWEIGNELYGNGTYGATWEYDTHGLGPATYANNVVSFSQAMKAVDPTIKIGLVLTAPGNWPDGQTSASSPQPWNDTVLPIACSSVDFVVAHWYAQGPGGESDAGLLSAPENGETTSVSSTPSIPSMVSTLRSKINQYCGSHASAVQIMVTETNSVSYNPGKQTVSLVNALFLDDDYMNWLENGVTNVDWWDLHNSIMTGTNDSPSLYGTADYGDYGVLSSGESSNGVSEPPADTPFPTYYGLQMLHKFADAGDQMLGASSNQSLIAVYAVKRADGSIAVLFINKDPSTTYAVTLSWTGFKPAPNPVAYFYGENSTSISRIREPGIVPDYLQVLPPYSLTALIVPPASQ